FGVHAQQASPGGQPHRSRIPWREIEIHDVELVVKDLRPLRIIKKSFYCSRFRVYPVDPSGRTCPDPAFRAFHYVMDNVTGETVGIQGIMTVSPEDSIFPFRHLVQPRIVSGHPKVSTAALSNIPGKVGGEAGGIFGIV